MRYLTFLLLVLLATAMACKQDASTPDDTLAVADESTSTDSSVSTAEARAYSVWNTAPNPESVTIDGAVVYVTHFGPELAPTQKDGDGYIAVYDANGTLVDTLYRGLHAPKGTVVLGKVLYVADVDRLIGINTSTGKKIVEVSFAGKTSFLNGLTAGVSDNLYVSGTDVGKIWRVVPRTQTVEEVADLPGANGLAYDAKRQAVYAVQYLQDNPTGGKIYLVDAETGAMRSESEYSGMLDGAHLRGGKLYFTDWNPAGAGRVVALDVSTRTTQVLAEDASFAGPANFDMLGDGLALVPMLTGSKVVAVPLVD